MAEPRAIGRAPTRPGFRGGGRLLTGGNTAPRVPSGGRVTKGKPAISFDRNIVLSEKFRAARPFGVPYVSPTREFADANSALAQEAIDDITFVLESRIKAGGRPQRSTQALIHALRAEENRDFNAQGFTVGIEAYLDSTPAGPYYRNLEYGSNVFVGRVIEGFFQSPGGATLSPIQGARDALKLIQTGPFNNPVDPPGGHTIPARRSERTGKVIKAKANQPGAGRFTEPLPGESQSARIAGTFPVAGQKSETARAIRKGRGGPVRPITIKNPIPEYAYFRDGITRFRRRAIGPGKLIAEVYRIAAKEFVDRGGLIIR